MLVGSVQWGESNCWTRVSLTLPNFLGFTLLYLLEQTAYLKAYDFNRAQI